MEAENVVRRRQKGKGGKEGRSNSDEAKDMAALPPTTTHTADPVESLVKQPTSGMDVAKKTDASLDPISKPLSAAPTAGVDFLESLDRRSAWILPMLVFALAAFTRFYRLDQPPGVVFE